MQLIHLITCIQFVQSKMRMPLRDCQSIISGNRILVDRIISTLR